MIYSLAFEMMLDEKAPLWRNTNDKVAKLMDSTITVTLLYIRQYGHLP